MKGIDTNILVRFLVGDDKDQTKIVYNIFKTTEAKQNHLYVPILVMLELLWVLESVYNISRSNIIESIKDLLLMPILKFEQRSAIQRITLTADTTNFDLSDLLIAESAMLSGCETVLTFDKRASRFKPFELAGN